MATIIRGGTVISPDRVLPNTDVIIQDGRIVGLVTSYVPQSDDSIIDAQGMWVAPGFIDIHVHGGNGFDTMDATREAVEGMGRFFAQHGVTSYYPTTMTDSPEAIMDAVMAVKECPQPSDGASHLGVHLEGPYLGTTFKGAQPDTYLTPPIWKDYQQWFDTGVAKLMTIDPDHAGAHELIAAGLRQGIEFAIGHSGANYASVTAAADHGVRQATHTFNGMRGLHHREPGTLGTVLSDDRIFAQVIADGIHVHPAMVKLLVRAKGIDRTILITDAMRAAGLPDGEYTLGANDVIVDDGIARLKEGNLAGSTATMDQVVRNVMAFAGVSLQDAITMATATPAAAMRLAGIKGTLNPGADADIVLLDEDLNISCTIANGKTIYAKT